SEKVQSFFPGLRENDLIWHQAGLQARLKGYPDFSIHSDPHYPHFINLVGIDSPGLTASLAIARRVAEMVDGLS
ncbi:MAG: FAD-dependent oxidoreductase, partial [Desulfatiglandales bacterium]|nr:FAD-dependent oxidoreductase [Desulfatiglandales bacterium]